MSLRKAHASGQRVQPFFFACFAWFALLLCALAPSDSRAQTGGQAGVQGTVTDASGANIPHATVLVTNQSTGVVSTRETTGEGLFTVSPIPPGIYSVQVKAPGFSDFTQQNLRLDALRITNFNVSLKPGAADQSVTVSEAPPQLETSNATLGLTLENETYSSLPLVMNNAQRDPTAFGALAPGAQGGARLPIVGGTGNYLGQLYLEGLPAQTVSQQGDNRLVGQSVSVDAIDQFQVVTSTPPAEYSGAGAQNFTLKSGGLKYHGQVSDYIRNTALDAWPFQTKSLAVRDNLGRYVPPRKPVDHQNEFSATFGGHVPGTKRVFFFVAYDKFHSRRVSNPAQATIATPLERSGDFTELNCPTDAAGAAACVGTGFTGNTGNPAVIFDPTTTVCTASGCTRQPFQGLKNGVLTNNVIPQSYLSPIALKAQSFLPAPNNPSTLTNNYTSTIPTGFDNYLLDYKVDFDISPRHRLSTLGAMGTVNYLNNFSTPYLPLPYTGGTQANIFPKNYAVEETWTISNSLVNQFKFGFTRFFQNIRNNTQGNDTYSIGTLGATNLPQGQAGQEFPGISFATTGRFGTALQTFTGNSNAQSTQLTTPNNFTLKDNLQYTKGKHSITAGITVQWQQINNANPATFTGILSLPFTANSTAPFGNNSTSLLTGAAATGSTPATGGGFSYASFLLGAVGGSPSLPLQYVSEVGGRYRPIAPYVEDVWKVNEKLTVDAGLRWDYLPPYREVKDRWSFLNPSMTNPATGTPGAIQFAGNYGGAANSCNCRTPVQTYWKNFGPRVGITYAFTEKTVLRAGLGRVFSQGGGVGGRGGAFNGTGQLGFNSTASSPQEVTSGAAAGPSFYLNNSAYFQSIGRANTSLFGPGYSYPGAPTPGVATQSINAGNYLNGNTATSIATAGAVSYADPYFSGRAPDFTFYNVGIQQALNNFLTLSINYVGNQSHHLINSTSNAANARGYWSNQLNPVYLAALSSVTPSGAVTGSILTAPANAANIAKAQQAVPGLSFPAFFAQAGAVNSSLTIAQGLVAFPQYSAQNANTTTTGGANGVTDLWGQNVANFSYNSLQVVLEQRFSHGLSFNANYTWSRNVGNDGTFRSGFDIPAAAISNYSGPGFKQDRMERSQTTTNNPHTIHAFGTYQLPFGRKGLGGTNAMSRAILSGFQLGAIYTYSSGSPMVLSSASCASPLQGQCMPNLNPNFAGNARIGGGYGRDAQGNRTACALGTAPPTGTTTAGTCPGSGTAKYFDSTAFAAPTPNSTTGTQLLGNAPRTGAMHLTNPGAWTFDMNLIRSFKVTDRFGLQLRADAINILNHTLFASVNSVYGNASFGTISSTLSTYNPRAFQLSGKVTF